MVVKVDEKFGPHPDLKRLYFTYLAIGALSILSFMPLIGLARVLLLPLFLPVCFIAYWIPRYYDSISYLFAKDEIVVERGVWWKTKGFVPYNRITNINIHQGPISRHFSLGTLRVQTAGYSGGGGGGAGLVAEAVILGVKNFEELKDFIMGFVRGIRPMAVEAEPEAPAPEEVSRQILEELKRIRETLEKGTA